MDRNEEWQQLIDEYRKIQVPPYVRDKMQEAVARGNARVAKRRRAAYISTAVSSVAAAVLILILLPNLNAHMAERMGRVPVVGGFFRAVTIRPHSGAESAADENGAPMALNAEAGGDLSVEDAAAYDDEAILLADGADAGVPETAGAVAAQQDADSSGIAAYSGETEIEAQEMYSDAGRYTELLVERFQEENAGEGGRLELTGCEVVTDSDDWFTLIIYAWEGGDDGYSELRRYYNVDKRRDMVMTLGELYHGRDYVAIISDEILNQMETRKAQTASALGDSEQEEERVECAECVFTRIDADQNYYFNEEGDLVIVLDTGQVNADLDELTEYVIDIELLE